jgi:hypothetical protein
MNKSEITFVVQGKVLLKDGVNLTELCVKSIRRFFPESRIILSTDIGEDTLNLDVDECVYSMQSDKVVIENDRVGNIMPANLQIVTTFEGLKRVKTPYAVKIRSDMVLKNDNLLWLMRNRPRRNLINKFKVCEQFVIILNWSAVNPSYYLKLLHHPSDQLFAGKTSDLLAIWNCPEYPVEYMRWYSNHDYPSGARHGNSLVKFRCETWIWYNFIKKYSNLDFNNSYDYNPELLEESQGFIANNLMIVGSKLAGVQSLKNPPNTINSKVKMFTYYDWLKLSRTYNNKIKLNIFDWESIYIYFVRLMLRVIGYPRFVFSEHRKGIGFRNLK